MANQIHTQDKNGARATHSITTGTIDAVTGGYFNGIKQTQAVWPESQDKPTRPTSHRQFEFVVRKAPNATDYPDSVAPIGSEFIRYIDASGSAVTEVRKYVKTAASTILSLTPHVRHINDLAGTVLINGAVTAAYSISLDGFTSATGYVAEGTVLTIGGVATTVLDTVAIASNAANNIPISVAITAANNAAVTITSFNALSTDDTIVVATPNAAVTVVLPPVATSKGCKLRIISSTDSSTNTVTVDGNGSELVNGAANIVPNVIYESCDLVCDGVKWFNFTVSAA
jgi:hypothetical protein